VRGDDVGFVYASVQSVGYAAQPSGPLTVSSNVTDKVGKAQHLPAFRTGLADFPHPALQLDVSTMGVQK
jgi:uncharacterized protein (DUF2235 family)